MREGLIPANPVKMLDLKERLQPKEGDKEYFTIDELKRIAEAPCPSSELKTAFRFACFTGLRISDVRKMTNKDIYLSPDGKTRYIYTEMVKTGGTISVPLSAEALRWLPTVEDDDALLFRVPQNASTLGRHLSQWMKAAKVIIIVSCQDCLTCIFSSAIGIGIKSLASSSISSLSIYYVSLQISCIGL